MRPFTFKRRSRQSAPAPARSTIQRAKDESSRGSGGTGCARHISRLSGISCFTSCPTPGPQAVNGSRHSRRSGTGRSDRDTNDPFSNGCAFRLALPEAELGIGNRLHCSLLSLDPRVRDLTIELLRVLRPDRRIMDKAKPRPPTRESDQHHCSAYRRSSKERGEHVISLLGTSYL